MTRWNYRVMRRVYPTSDGIEIGYGIYEVYYDGDDVASWTQEPCGSPHGEAMSEMVEDFAWIAAALAKPVLDHADGTEVEPAPMLADEIKAVIGGANDS